MMVGKVAPEKLSYRRRNYITAEAEKWFEARKIKAFYSVVDGLSFEEGVRALVQASGFGKLCPNIVLMGYKSDWRYCLEKDLTAYFNVLHNAFDNRLAVAILRLPNGLDYSHLNTEVHINMADIPEVLTPSNTGSINNLNTVHGSIDVLNSVTHPARRFMHTDSNLNSDMLHSALRTRTLMHADSNLNIGTPDPLTASQTSINLPKSKYTLLKINFKMFANNFKWIF